MSTRGRVETLSQVVYSAYSTPSHAITITYSEHHMLHGGVAMLVSFPEKRPRECKALDIISMVRQTLREALKLRKED